MHKPYLSPTDSGMEKTALSTNGGDECEEESTIHKPYLFIYLFIYFKARRILF